MRLVLRWLASAVALLLVAYYIPGITVVSFSTALIAAFVLGFVNAVIRPLAVLITLPVNILTLGLFTFLINAMMFWLASVAVPGFEVAGFWSAFWGALIMSLVGWAVNIFLKKK